MTYLMAFEQNIKSTLAISTLNKVKNWLLGREKSANNEILTLQSVCNSLVGSTEFNFFRKHSDKMISDSNILINLGKAIDQSLESNKELFFELVNKLSETKDASTITQAQNEFLVKIIRKAIHHIDNNMINHEISSNDLLEVKGF